MTLKDSIFLGLCAMLAVLGRALLRLHLHLPGHSLLILTACLMLARGCVNHVFAATLTGLLAGLLALVLGMVKVTPLFLLHFVLPGVVVDVCARFMPRLFQSYLLCGVVGALVGATKFLDTFSHDLLAGMDSQVAVSHAALSAAPAAAFGILGSLVAPPLLGRLRARGVIA